MVLLPKVHVSADVLFPRLVELVNDLEIPILRVQVPEPVIYPSRKTGGIRRRGSVFEPMLLWGPIERPVFEFPEEDLPY